MIGSMLFVAQLVFWLIVYVLVAYVLWRYGPHDGHLSAAAIVLILLWPFALAALIAAAIAEMLLHCVLGAARYARNVLR